MQRATQIIASAREMVQKKEMANDSFDSNSTNSNTRRRSSRLSKVVSFSDLCSTIGISSYAINPLICLQNVADRAPTPVVIFIFLTVLWFNKKKNLKYIFYRDHWPHL